MTDWLYEGMTNTTDANDGYFNFFRGSFVHNSAIWISPGLSLFAFASFNDSLVSEYLIPSMNGRWAPVRLRYPRAGCVNPEVTLNVMKLLNDEIGKQWRIQPPQEVSNRWDEHYYLR